jgi:prepilin-type N-terminal cleavage/methylation domain-containing protein
MNKDRSLIFKSAFSLIELSIVVLIIGILIAGVTQGSRLVKQSKLKIAKNQTQNSAVASIPGLAAWFETTSENSVNSASNGLSPDDNDLVSSWIDINPQSTSKVIVSNSASFQPTYVVNGIGGLPSVQFGGTQFLTSIAASGGNIPLQAKSTAFTFIVVWNKTGAALGAIIDQGSANVANLRAGMLASALTGNAGTYGFCGNANDFLSTATYNASANMISIITVNSSGTVNIYDNVSSYSGSITPTSSLTSSVFNIGANAATSLEQFVGKISEVIIFSRALKSSEIANVKFYLSQKYGIPISGAAQ